ncbi:hypothetical protein C0993_008108 [Termitomyces sp. T159_Od127]|nr:hypothetical protein C0993_008108 [Termitomyces sp. T159_Od127]
MTGFDASGHIAEETKNARIVAGKGILSSAIATGIMGFITTILFLFCTPDFDTLFSLNAPQPFVQIYALALGKGGSVFMTIIAALGLIMVCSSFYAQACVIFGAVTLFGIISWWITPEEKWLRRELVLKAFEDVNS